MPGTPDIFASLRGSWKVSRRITSKTPSTTPGGHFTGTAEFRARKTTFSAGSLETMPSGSRYSIRAVLPRPDDQEEDDGGDDDEYLYVESGTFATATWSTSARRRYIYQRKQPAGLTAWFVKPDSEEEVDYFFHEVDEWSVEKKGENKEEKKAQPVATVHLCGDDVYETEYKLLEWDEMRGEAKKFGLTYTVKGPRKDYIAEAVYERRVHIGGFEFGG